MGLVPSKKFAETETGNALSELPNSGPATFCKLISILVAFGGIFSVTTNLPLAIGSLVSAGFLFSTGALIQYVFDIRSLLLASRLKLVSSMNGYSNA